jgi:hypothetical protein
MVDAIVALLGQMPVFLAPKPWEDWSLFSEQIARGVAIGSAYALVALAIVLVFRSSELLNFAQGEWGMFTTFVAWSLVVAGTAVGWACLANHDLQRTGAGLRGQGRSKCIKRRNSRRRL